MSEKNNIQSKSKTDDGEMGEMRTGGQQRRGKSGKGTGQIKEKQYEDGERDPSEQGDGEIKGIFMEGHIRGRKGGLRGERWGDKKDGQT